MIVFNELKNTNQDSLNKYCSKKGRLLGIDAGTKRIGLALCDETHLIASPKLILNRQGNLKDFIKIKDFIDENKVVGIVIGLPIQMDDSEIPMTIFAQNFADNLDKFLEQKLPIFFFDERLTSFEARNLALSKLSRKNNKIRNKFVDDIAASLILQGFIDSL